jgi:phosphoribosylformimino-5-aminoimidazole carboxamide ribotide isomerase
MVATEGWLETSSTSAIALIARIAEHTQSCAAIVYTDISKDGMLEGPNFTSMAEVQQAAPFPVIASGGVTTLADVRRLVRQRTAGAIIGRALYEGVLDLREALHAADGNVDATAEDA